MATTNSTIEKIAPMFTDLLIKKIECLKTIGKSRGFASSNKFALQHQRDALRRECLDVIVLH